MDSLDRKLNFLFNFRMTNFVIRMQPTIFQSWRNTFKIDENGAVMDMSLHGYWEYSVHVEKSAIGGIRRIYGYIWFSEVACSREKISLPRKHFPFNLGYRISYNRFLGTPHEFDTPVIVFTGLELSNFRQFGTTQRKSLSNGRPFETDRWITFIVSDSKGNSTPCGKYESWMNHTPDFGGHDFINRQYTCWESSHRGTSILSEGRLNVTIISFGGNIIADISCVWLFLCARDFVSLQFFSATLDTLPIGSSAYCINIEIEWLNLMIIE